MNRLNQGKYIGLVILTIFLFSITVAAKHKDDVIIFKNGDRLTGEIKKLDHGQLYFKNSSMYETIRLDWAQIARIESLDQYVVELTNGERVLGNITKAVTAAGQPEFVEIKPANGSATVLASRREVISVVPAEGTFWRQLSGSIDAGFSFTQGNAQTNFNLQTTAQYVTSRYSFQTALDTSFNGQSDAETNRRINWGMQGRYFLNRKWFIPGVVDLLTNSQQQLDLRTTFGGGIGRVLKRTEKTSVAAIGGLVVNRERYSPESGLDPNHTEFEGMAGISANTFQFDKLEGETNLLFYGRSGRVRSDFNASIRWKLVSKLYWKFSFYNNFDSSPPTATKKNDFGTSSSIGWKF